MTESTEWLDPEFEVVETALEVTGYSTGDDDDLH